MENIYIGEYIGEYSLPGGYFHVKWNTKIAMPVPGNNMNTVKVFVSEDELRNELNNEEISLLKRGWYWLAR